MHENQVKIFSLLIVCGWLSKIQAQLPPPVAGGYSMGPLPFPLFPMPCGITCNQGGLFFANIVITNPQQQARPGAGTAGMSGGGAPTTRQPTSGAAGSGGTAAGAGAVTRPPSQGGSAASGAGATPTRPPTSGAGVTTRMTTRAPQVGGAGMTAPPSPNINAQIMYFYPDWCTGWCRFFYGARPIMPPPPPPLLPHPARLLFSWLGL